MRRLRPAAAMMAATVMATGVAMGAGRSALAPKLHRAIVAVGMVGGSFDQEHQSKADKGQEQGVDDFHLKSPIDGYWR
jgi:hypothetical protein